MQNTMLDSTISSNSQELFDLNAEHNGEACIESLNPEDRGTERQFWFTVAMLCVIYGVADRTLRDNIESLIVDGELVSADFRRDASVLDINGVPHKTTIYNLEVLNKLGMCCFRGNKKAKEIRNKFNDVLVERETGVTQNQSMMLPNFCNPAEAARAWADLYEKNQAAEKRAITAMATASSARAHQHFAEKVLETHASELITLRAVVDEQRSHLWDANQTAHEIYRLKALKKDYSLNTLQNKARHMLSRFATKLGKRPIPFPNGATYTDSLGRLQPSMSTYYERDVVDAVLDWVVEHPNDFARVGGKRDPLLDEW